MKNKMICFLIALSLLVLGLIIIGGLGIYNNILKNEIKFRKLDNISKAEKYFQDNIESFFQYQNEIMSLKHVIYITNDKSKANAVYQSKRPLISCINKTYIVTEDMSSIDCDEVKITLTFGSISTGNFEYYENEENKSFWFSYVSGFAATTGFIYIENIANLPDMELNFLCKLEKLNENWYWFMRY